MEEALPLQIFIRNQKGTVWGPLTPETVELLIENGIVQGQIQVSKDGLNFAFAARFPEFRDFIPRELWGDAAAAASAPAAQPAPGAPAPAAARMTPSPGTLTAGPGAVANAASARPIMAGPGAKAAADPSVRPTRPVGVSPPAPKPPPPKPPPAPVAAVAPPPRTPTPAPMAPKPATTQPIPPPTMDGATPPPASGDLAKLSPIHLYYLAASGDHTGLLRFKLADRAIDVHFRKGNPEYVSSDHAEDALGGFLLKQGMATGDQIAQAEGQKERFGGELVGALFGMGVLNPQTAFAQITQRAQSILLKALVAEGGSFTYDAKELPPQKAMPLGNRWSVLSETIRKVPGPELQRRLRDSLDLPVMKSGGRVPVADLRLTPRETRALTFIDGVRSLNQLVKDVPQESENFLRVAFLLQYLESVSFAAVPVRPVEMPKAAPSPQAPQPAAAKPAPAKPAPAAAPKPPAAGAPKITAPASRPTPAPVAPSATPAPTLSPEAELPQLRAFAAKLKSQNFFELLGLTEKTDGGAVKVAYFKLAKQYHPDTVPPAAPPEYGKLKAEIFAAIGEANRRLADDKSRADYITELKEGANQVDVAQIFAAEEMFAKAKILVKARKYPEAVATIEDAIKANPEEGEFYALRGYARFFTHKDRAAGLVAATKDIQLALKKNERCAMAHYYHGSMARLAGDDSTAMKEFKLTLAIQPDHVDAQRELRMVGKK